MENENKPKRAYGVRTCPTDLHVRLSIAARAGWQAEVERRGMASVSELVNFLGEAWNEEPTERDIFLREHFPAPRPSRRENSNNSPLKH